MRRQISSASADRPARLRARLHARLKCRGLAILEKELQIGHLRLPFAQIPDPNRVLDQIVEEADRRERVTGRRQSDDELHLPYWAELWDSALGVGQFLLTTNASEVPADVLDLGCGMGLGGAVAAAMGCRVLLVDLEESAVLFARLNTLAYGRRARVRRLDWRRDVLNEQFDLILGSDVLYERAQWEFLEKFWRTHLRPNGSIILGEPGRQTGDTFPQWIQTRGWHLEQSAQTIPTRPAPIRIFRLSRQT